MDHLQHLLGLRNPVPRFFTGERLTIVYSAEGEGVKSEVQKLRDSGIL